MRISILSSAHKYNDDRLYYHFSKSLSDKGHIVNIVTSDTYFEEAGNISISSFNGLKHTRKGKIKIYINKLSHFDPDIVICLEPITIIAAKRYSKNKNISIIYDITEWYPSKYQLKNHFFALQFLLFLFYFFLFIYTCFLVDGFIYGEYYKGKLSKKLFPKKKNIQISYYPNKEYIERNTPAIQNNSLRLCYTGSLNTEKGVINFLNVLKELINTNNELEINVKFIGEFDSKDKDICLNKIRNLDKNIHVSFFPFQELTNYIKLINDTDIFLDLRSLDLINSHSLPIKLFYFMALQRPVIYTNLKAIKKEIEIKSFGFLVNPKDSKKIAKIINTYQNDNVQYISHCTRAKDLFELKYNWNILEGKFIHFIEGFRP